MSRKHCFETQGYGGGFKQRIGWYVTNYGSSRCIIEGMIEYENGVDLEMVS